MEIIPFRFSQQNRQILGRLMMSSNKAAAAGFSAEINCEFDIEQA
jgi:hypothetical protein